MLEVSLLSQIIITFLAAGTLLQQGGGGAAQSFIEPITNSLTQFATTIAEAAPKIVAALVLLGIGLLIGRIIGWIVRKVAEKMNLDRYWSRTGIGESVSRAGWNLTRIFQLQLDGLSICSLSLLQSMYWSLLNCPRLLMMYGYGFQML